MAHGRHRKPKESRAAKRWAAGAVVAGTGVSATVMATNDTHAASVSTWDKIAECESGGRWNLSWGDRDSTGGLQIRQGTWNDFGGQQYAPQPYLATKAEQIAVAQKILAGQGSNAWAVTTNGSACSGMRFGVYPLPYGPPTTYRKAKPIPAPTHKGATHTVVSGDTLWGIAPGHNWKPLYEANKAKIGSDPNLILPGQVLALSGEGRPKVSAPRSSSAEYQLPVHGGVSQVFWNYNSRYSLDHHTGVDFRAGYGTVVHAATGGTVVSSDTSPAYGINVQVKNNDGTYALYAHLSSRSVSPGQKIRPGQQIGNVGSTGTSSGAHLHFEIRIRPTFGAGNFVDPVDWLREHGVKV